MTNYTPQQVYERVPLRGTKPDQLIFTGTFAAPGGNAADVAIELRITSPAAAITTVSGIATPPFPDTDGPGNVEISIQIWDSECCGADLEYEVRGFQDLPLVPDGYTPWESFKAKVAPRSDNGRRTWVRKVDGDMHVVPDSHQPSRRWYPATLDELIWCVQNQYDVDGPNASSHACGSHWAMSQAAVTPGQMFETATSVHEAWSDQFVGRLNNVLYDVVPGCLTPEAFRFFMGQNVPVYDPNLLQNDVANYLFHVEAGARIHEIYAYIDDFGETQPEARKRSLAQAIEDALNAQNTPPPHNPFYFGPWAFETLGGAGGQTIVGVASTATHGGDVQSSAVGEMILAVHLIAPDGQEYWIERTRLRPGTIPMQLVDPDKLRQVYRVGDPSSPGGAQRRGDIIYRRDDDLMNAVLVSCGRMGIIYSVVLRTVRQYGLNQVTKEDSWAETKKWIAKPLHPVNGQMLLNRFVRIDVDLYPQPDFDWWDAALAFAALALAGPVGFAVGAIIGLKGNDYRAWHLTRTKVKLADTSRVDGAGQPYFYGRPERGGTNAGLTSPLEADPDKGCFTKPCRSANFVRQFLTDMIGQLSDIRDEAIEKWIEAGAAMLLFPPNASWALPLQAMMIGVIAFTEYWILVLSGIRHLLPNEAKFGDFICAAMNTLGDLRACSLVQLLYSIGQESEHLDTSKPLVAISYGVMDEHDYLNRGCVAPGDSIEFFFDGTTPDFVDFVDYVIDQVRDLADEGKMLAGYLSLRFMSDSPSFLAMQRWPRTVSMEIASLSKVSGADEFMYRIEAESLNRGIILHWGQRNNRVQADVESKFYMGTWRDALSEVSEHGRLANFSTEFTRVKGLEITVPRLYGFSAGMTEGCARELTTVRYDAFNNPPGTSLIIFRKFANGSSEVIDVADLRGEIELPFGNGKSTLELRALRVLNGNKYQAPPLSLTLRGFATGDIWEFRKETELRLIGGANRWFTELNLFSSFISNSLRVSEVQLSASSTSGWILHKPPLPDVQFPGLIDTQSLPTQPTFNTNWQFYSAAPASGATPILTLRFKIVC